MGQVSRGTRQVLYLGRSGRALFFARGEFSAGRGSTDFSSALCPAMAYPGGKESLVDISRGGARKVCGYFAYWFWMTTFVIGPDIERGRIFSGNQQGLKY